MKPQTTPNMLQFLRVSCFLVTSFLVASFLVTSFLMASVSLAQAAPSSVRAMNNSHPKFGNSTGQQTLSPSAVPVQSFGEWKEQKIHEVQLEVEALQAKVEAKKADTVPAKGNEKAKLASPADPGLAQLKNQLNDKIYSLEMAKELTVADYFAAYLTKLENKKESFKEIAAKMTAEEVADLMSAYANAMFSSQGSSAAPQGLNAPFDRVK